MRELTAELLDQIDNYLSGAMSETERSAFSKEIEEDSSLQQLVNEQQEIIIATEKIEHNRLKDLMNDFHEETIIDNEKPQARIFKLNSFKAALIAASVAFLVAIAIPLIRNNNEPIGIEQEFGSGKPFLILNEQIMESTGEQTVKILLFKKAKSAYSNDGKNIVVHYPEIVKKEQVELISLSEIKINNITYQIPLSKNLVELKSN